MITNSDRQKLKVKPYFPQISSYCIGKSTECMESIDIENMDCDTCPIVKEILSDEINDSEFLEFAIVNFSEMLEYITQRNLNISIHRDITGEMWFGMEYILWIFNRFPLQY